MKKLTAIALAGILGITGVTTTAHVFANTNDTTVEANQVTKVEKGKFLETFQTELHQSNDLKQKRLDLKKSVINKRDQLIDLVVQAKNNKDKEALKALKAIKPSLKENASETKSIVQQLRDERKAAKTALKAGDEDQARTHINKVLELQASWNKNLEGRASILDQMIAALTK
ncbi:hypothetical protein [Falsibacillus pallidus]|uniref:hypothetical protein n=1 Tax=Falsibacillus pallidus TaxID=493781 RepID=UPI003D99E1FE